jgi:hypothetical protein
MIKTRSHTVTGSSSNEHREDKQVNIIMYIVLYTFGLGPRAGYLCEWTIRSDLLQASYF